MDNEIRYEIDELNRVIGSQDRAIVNLNNTINKIGQQLTDCELKLTKEQEETHFLHGELATVRDMLGGLGEAMHYHPIARIESAITYISYLLYPED